MCATASDKARPYWVPVISRLKIGRNSCAAVFGPPEQVVGADGQSVVGIKEMQVVNRLLQLRLVVQQCPALTTIDGLQDGGVMAAYPADLVVNKGHAVEHD